MCNSLPHQAREFDNFNYVMERAITGDFAMVKAWKADKAGNLTFRSAYKFESKDIQFNNKPDMF